MSFCRDWPFCSKAGFGTVGLMPKNVVHWRMVISHKNQGHGLECSEERSDDLVPYKMVPVLGARRQQIQHLQNASEFVIVFKPIIAQGCFAHFGGHETSYRK